MRGESSLYSKFETVLSRMGIELQFEQQVINDDQGNVVDSTVDHTQTSDLFKTQIQPSIMPLRGKLRHRRKSESSIWDLGPEPARSALRRRSVSNLSSQGTSSSSQRFTSNVKVSGDYRGGTKNPLSTPPEQNGEHEVVGAWMKKNQGNEPPKPHANPTAIPTDKRLRRALPSADQHDRGEYSAPAASNDIEHFLGDANSVRVPEYGPRRNRDTDFTRLRFEEFLDAQASLLERYRAQLLALRFFRLWRQHLTQLQEDNSYLEQLAGHLDKHILLRQAFDSWQMSYQQLIQTRAFFDHLERRTSRARNLYLLTKAFTHWASAAHDVVQRTSAARRHILRIRYFKAWREITAVNELKVRRHIIKKFFVRWQERFKTNRFKTDTSVVVYESSVVSKIFWAWFWNFCERKAPANWTRTLKHESFLAWLSIIRRHHDHAKAAMEYYEKRGKGNAFLLWAQRYGKLAALSFKAIGHDSATLRFRCLSIWRLNTSVVVPMQLLQRSMTIRIKRSALQNWSLRVSQERKARAFDRLKITHEALITWNYKLRCQLQTARINHRLVLQTLYRWVVKERLILSRRLIDQQALQSGLQSMIRKSRLALNNESRNLRLAKDFSDSSMKRRVISYWRYHLVCQRDREWLATSIKLPSRLTNALAKWTEKAQHFRQLRKWASDGDFYFLTVKKIRLWKTAMERSRREKRRKAYTKCRRRTKITLASGVLSAWQSKTNIFVEQNLRADEIRQNRNIIFGLEVFDRWRARTDEIAELETFLQQTVLKRFYRIWASKYTDITQQQLDALAIFEDRLTGQCWKKWARRALHLRAQEFISTELCEKHNKWLARKTIVHWRQRMHPTAALFKEQAYPDENERVEAWSEFGEGQTANDWAPNIDALEVSTPLPAYLNTPSKRATRSNLVSKLSSTTPSAALSTPVEKHLRAQYSEGLLSSLRGTRNTTSLKDRGGLAHTYQSTQTRMK